ncbi:MAG: ABC transporter substrate-binding protein [Motiliproteus sp.]
MMPTFPLLLLIGSLLFSTSSSAETNNQDRLVRIQQTSLLRVCIWPDYYSITYRNPKTQTLSGIDIEMAQQLASDLGVELEFVDSSFSKLVDDVTSDRCDIAMFGVGVTASRQKSLRFSSPHLVSDIYAISSKTNRRVQDWSNIDQAGTIVAVAKGTLHEPVMKNKLKQAELLILDSPFAREQEVQSGRADVFMTDYPYSQRFLVSADWARLIAPPSEYHSTPYAYAMQPGDDRWHARVEQFVSDVKKDGRLLRAARRYQLDPIIAK